MLPLSYTRYTIQVVTPLTQLTKSHDTVLLARPTFINSSATHNLSRRPFSPKNQRRLLPCLLYKSFFRGLQEGSIRKKNLETLPTPTTRKMACISLVENSACWRRHCRCSCFVLSCWLSSQTGLIQRVSCWCCRAAIGPYLLTFSKLFVQVIAVI